MPLADEINLGGTGFGIEVKDGKERYIKSKDPCLPHDIEYYYPDYGLYPELTKDTAFGFLTRGCPNRCGFCVVSAKEGAERLCGGFVGVLARPAQYHPDGREPACLR